MRLPVLSSLLFALISSISVAANAATPSGPAVQPAVTVTAPATINLNTADAETLQRELLGIGAAKAQAIVAHRDSHGAFASIDELLEVKGIGKSLLDKNREKLALE